MKARAGNNSDERALAPDCWSETGRCVASARVAPASGSTQGAVAPRRGSRFTRLLIELSASAMGGPTLVSMSGSVNLGLAFVLEDLPKPEIQPVIVLVVDDYIAWQCKVIYDGGVCRQLRGECPLIGEPCVGGGDLRGKLRKFVQNARWSEPQQHRHHHRVARAPRSIEPRCRRRVPRALAGSVERASKAVRRFADCPDDCGRSATFSPARFRPAPHP